MNTLLHVLTHTPAWVFGLFLLLLALGVRQMRDSRVRPTRLAAMPLAMCAFSLYGVVSTFGLNPLPLTAWLAGAAFASTAVLLLPPPRASRYDAADRTIHLPGSAAPLASMMAFFFTKYALTVVLVMHPALRHDAPLTLAAGTIYGSFSGLFAGRALRVGRHLLRGPILP